MYVRRQNHFLRCAIVLWTNSFRVTCMVHRAGPGEVNENLLLYILYECTMGMSLYIVIVTYG